MVPILVVPLTQNEVSPQKVYILQLTSTFAQQAQILKLEKSPPSLSHAQAIRNEIPNEYYCCPR